VLGHIAGTNVDSWFNQGVLVDATLTFTMLKCKVSFSFLKTEEEMSSFLHNVDCSRCFSISPF